MAENDQPIPIQRIDPAIELDQVASLERILQERSASAVKESLDEVEATAGTESNLFPPISRAVEAYATLGEITDRLRKVFGEYQEGVSW